MPYKINHKLFAPCGMNCMVCYVHLKAKKPCDGCLCADTHKTERCKACQIKACADEKGLTYCYECDDFPCLRIKNLDKSYRKRYQVSLIENSKAVFDKGLETFLLHEKKRWTCADCNGVISLHDKQCSKCGKTDDSTSG